MCSAASRRTTSRLTARRCCPTSARHRGHPRLPHRGTRRPGLALRYMRHRDVLLALLCQPQLPEVPHRTNQGVARTPPGGDAAGAAFHVTITVPAELREVLRAHQRDGYAVLMQASAGAIIELARDPRYVGGTVAVLAVLHTWTQQLNLHPHVHCLVSGGGISEDAATLASGTPEVPGAHQGSRQIGARQVPGPPAPKVSRSRHSRRRVEETLDPPRHRLGRR